jgi:5-methylthioadenosine/S-adenosylhomocysteine deaminase
VPAKRRIRGKSGVCIFHDFEGEGKMKNRRLVCSALLSGFTLLIFIGSAADTQLPGPDPAVVSLSGDGSQAVQEFILGGTIVTPNTVIPKGWITIKNGKIEAVQDKLLNPGNFLIVETGGIIIPGLIDLHNHPMYNVYPRWAPGREYFNRYEWRNDDTYMALIGRPGRELQQKEDSDLTFCDLDIYAEVKALIGGTTSITGISRRRKPLDTMPLCLSCIIRNLDWASGFYGPAVGAEKIESLVGISLRDLNDIDAQRIAKGLEDNSINLLLVHVAEGKPSDTASVMELQALKCRGFLGDRTAVIHGLALGEDEFRLMRAANASLIWSPRSNLELYGVTTDIAAAIRQGVSIALAPDWSPTGSTNMLAELRYAREYNLKHLGGLLSDRMLFEMATSVPARIAKIDNWVGTIRPGLFADLVVLKGDSSDPFAAIANARSADIQMVMVGGNPLHGMKDLLEQFKVNLEPISVCGQLKYLNSAALLGKTFASVEQRLRSVLSGYKIDLAPIEECIR